MDFGHQRIGGGGYDRKRIDNAVGFRVFPFAPESGKGKGFSVFSKDKERIGAPFVMVVLIKSIDMDNTAVMPRGISKRRLFKNGLAPCVQRIVPGFFQLFPVPDPVGDKAPSGHLGKLRGTVRIDQQFRMNEPGSMVYREIR